VHQLEKKKKKKKPFDQTSVFQTEQIPDASHQTYFEYERSLTCLNKHVSDTVDYSYVSTNMVPPPFISNYSRSKHKKNSTPLYRLA